jgi:hypothetical protein
MAVTTFKPEVWASVLLEAEKNAHVFVGVCNKDFEPMVEGAESVRINTIGRPTVNSYTGTITYEAVDTASQVLQLNQKKYIAFKVDDVDRAQAAGNFWTANLNEGAYALSDAKDQLVAGLYTDVATANKVNSGSAVGITSGDLAYTGLKNLMVELDEASAPRHDRWVVVPPWYHGLLLDNNKFVDASASGSTDPLKNGFVGRALGFDVFVSNNVVLVTGDDYAVLAGSKSAITFADQLQVMEAAKAETFFGDYVRSLHIYGAKVVKPSSLAYQLSSVT